MDHEEVESIPWRELLDDRPPRHDVRRTATLAAGFVVAAILGGVVTRSWWAPTAPVVIAPAPEVAAQGSESAATTTTILPGALFSEADLLAVPHVPGERAAVARAEWFVTDYFTADYEPTGSAEVRSSLPAAADLPDMPQDGRGGISYVEWARAFRVEPLGEGMYLVSVAFRTLAAPPDGAFIRLPVRAVGVVVEVGTGGATVVDLPRPATLPTGPEPPPWPAVTGEPPEDVLAVATGRAAAWGNEPRIASAALTESGWRLVMTVSDDVGNRWPLSILVGT